MVIFNKELILEDILLDIEGYLEYHSEDNVTELDIVNINRKTLKSYNRPSDIEFLNSVQNEIDFNLSKIPILTVNNKILRRSVKGTFLEDYTPCNWNGYFTTALDKGYVALNISEMRRLYEERNLKSIETTLKHESIHYQQYLEGRIEIGSTGVKWTVPGEEIASKDIDKKENLGHWLLDTLRLPWEQETYLTCHVDRILGNLTSEEISTLKDITVPSLQHLLLNLN